MRVQCRDCDADTIPEQRQHTIGHCGWKASEPSAPPDLTARMKERIYRPQLNHLPPALPLLPPTHARRSLGPPLTVL